MAKTATPSGYAVKAAQLQHRFRFVDAKLAKAKAAGPNTRDYDVAAFELVEAFSAEKERTEAEIDTATKAADTDVAVAARIHLSELDRLFAEIWRMPAAGHVVRLAKFPGAPRPNQKIAKLRAELADAKKAVEATGDPNLYRPTQERVWKLEKRIKKLEEE